MPAAVPAAPSGGEAADGATAAAHAWFAARGWRPHAFQGEVWAAMAAGDSGLLHATTGSGKTYAVWLGALLRAARQPAPRAAGLQVLWITPMRALASDTVKALQAPLAAMAPGWTVGQRTGDTAAAERARQDRRLPPALVTTPESLSLLLTRADAAELLGGVHTVVVDEWHELVATKRGVQVQLALARLARWHPGLAVWGLSATLGNLEEAMHTLVGPRPARPPRLVQGRLDKTLVIDTLLPAEPGRFSWSGHLGAQMLAPVVAEIERSSTTLVFTNTRAQAEIWYQLLLQERPAWAGTLALHHGSLDRGTRDWVEAGLKDGRLRAVVATSSLDLGVDFLPVERVLQIGSAKGVARLLQRAGRSGHAPGRASRATLVPTHTMELVEAAAARRAVAAGAVEPRRSPDKPLDVLVQHLVTVALGGGFDAGADGRGAPALRDEVRGCWAYRDLADDEFDWALAFVERGGDSLSAYPEYHRVAQVDGRWTVPDRGVARRHRMQVGTIVSEATVQVKWMNGATLGSIEEGFVARLRKGDCFIFAGRLLEYLRTHEMAAYVRPATRSQGAVPTWAGSKLPLSTELAAEVQALLEQAAQGRTEGPEMAAAAPMLAAQAALSRIPTRACLLLEQLRSREGHHVFLYPFAGRRAHAGLAQLLAWRLAQRGPNSFSLSVNDYGLEILGAKPVDLPGALADGLLSDRDLAAHVLASLNSGELAQRRFREIARVSGLVFGGFPGQPKSMRQLQASSSLFFEVFRKYDAGNRLLVQAEQEVLSQELDLRGLSGLLRALAERPPAWVELRVTSPFALPLRVARLREQVSSEQLKDRLDRLLAESEAALAETARPAPRRRAARRVRAAAA